MSGRFDGLTDVEWELFRNIFPSEVHGGRGRPVAHPRNVLNSLLYILIVGYRWFDLPQGIKKFKSPAAEVMASGWDAQ